MLKLAKIKVVVVEAAEDAMIDVAEDDVQSQEMILGQEMTEEVVKDTQALEAVAVIAAKEEALRTNQAQDVLIREINLEILHLLDQDEAAENKLSC